MAKIIQCPNGHYYDSGMYEKCPYCENRVSTTKVIPRYTINTYPEPEMPETIYMPPPVLYGPPVIPSPAPPSPEERPAVGCLVAVSGPHCGESFALYERYNYIGRESGDIVLAKDRCVSRVKNAWIMYSYTRNRFKIGAGESVNIVYVNQEELTADSSVVLEPYDLIEIGQSKLRFIPFEDKAL